MPDQSTGEEFLDPDFLERIRAIFLGSRKRRQQRKRAAQHSSTSGFTREFKDFRHYTINDDYRAIDWRLYARLDRLFIRLYEEIQEYHVHVITDVSLSMAQPYTEKRETALKLTIALSYLGLVGQHQVSVYPMGERIDNPLPPMKGQGNLKRIIEYASSLEFSAQTNLENSFQKFQPSRQKQGILFVISDLYGQQINEAELAIRHASSWPGEVHMIQVYHPEEENPSLDGELQLIDSETQEKRRFRLTEKELGLYRDNYQNFLTNIQTSCRQRQINYQPWRTDLPFEDLFLNWLAQGSAIPN